jgi:hypothetical protein
MKLSLIVLFLTILLLCGVLLRAAGNNRCTIRTHRVQEAVTEVQVKKDMQLVPNVILL